MGMALGRSVEDEYKPGLSELGRVRDICHFVEGQELMHEQRVYGNVGLFFTNSPPQEVTEWFDDHKVDEFARAGAVATKTVVIPAGSFLQNPLFRVGF
jgi:mRNA turnover protein 4